jgi:hypothetical protein
LINLIGLIHPPLQLRQNQLLVVCHLLAQRLDLTQLSYQVRCGLWCFWRWHWHWFQHSRRLRGCFCCLGCLAKGGRCCCRRCRSSYSIPPVVKRRHDGVLQSFLRFHAQFDFGRINCDASAVVADTRVRPPPHPHIKNLAKEACSVMMISYVIKTPFHS